MLQPEPTLNEIQEIAVVSGANGFIGTHLCRTLAKSGVKVVAIPRDILLKTALLRDFLRKCNPTYIFHLAAYGNHSTQTGYEQTIDVNYMGTYSLLLASKRIPYKAFVNVSSSSVLLDHETFYSATKAGAERLCRAFYSEYGKPIITARPYSIYGIGEAEFRFIPTAFKCALLGETLKLAPDAVHDWLYVDSFVEGIVRSATKYIDRMQGKAWNFGTGIGTNNMDVVKLIAKITDKKINIIPQSNMRSFDSKSWACALNEESYLWTDEYMPTLEEGLERIYGYYKQALKAKNYRD